MQHELTVYYDGACIICSKKIEYYQKQKRGQLIKWVDIASPMFDALAEGLDHSRAQRAMHSRRPDGTLHTGVDSFLEIWKVLGGYSWLRAIFGFKALRPFWDLGYAGFARARIYLPKRKSPCSNGVCELGCLQL